MVEITTDAGKSYTAKVIGSDEKTDLALIKVDGASDFPYVKFADGTPRVGDWVIAVGNPFGLGGTVTAGIVSARGRDIGAGAYDDFIQIDAPVNKGNSGGPAFDENGNVIGVTTAIYSPSGGSVGIGFAIPADTVKSVVDQLKQSGTVTRGWIGVQVQTVTQDIADSMGLKKTEGALVAQPQADGPAAKAGVASGDLIQSVNGQKVKDSRDLAKKIGAINPGSTGTLGILHNGAEKTVSLTVGKMPGQNGERHASRHPGSEGVPPPGAYPCPSHQCRGRGQQGRRGDRRQSRRAGGGARRARRRHHPRHCGQAGECPLRRAPSPQGGELGGQAHGPDAHQVRRLHAFRGHADRRRLTATPACASVACGFRSENQRGRPMRWPRLMSSAYLAFSFHAREKLVQELHECRLERCPPRPVPALGHHFAQTVKEVAERLASSDGFRWPSVCRRPSEQPDFRFSIRMEIFWRNGSSSAGRAVSTSATTSSMSPTSQSDEKTNPPFRQGIRIGSVKDGKVTAFMPQMDPKLAMPEGLAADKNGNVFGGFATDMDFKKFAKN